MRRLLVTGAGGQVGWSLLRATPPDRLDVRGFPRSGLDVLDPEAIAELVRDAELVVNTAAHTEVDKAEGDRDRAFAVNAEAPRLLAERCAELGVPLIHLSSDYVFDGTKTTPYVEDDPICPINVYGESKAAGEEAVRETLDEHIILRTSWIYAGHGKNFVRTMLSLADRGEPLRVVDDQFGAPTAATDVAAAVLAVADKLLEEGGPYGTFHYAAEGVTTWYGLAEEVFGLVERRKGMRPVVEPIPSDDYPTFANRPKYSVLDCTKIVEAFAPPRRPWQEGVAEVVEAALDVAEESLSS
jgi:dTDP-4-dehydrorhamnose reductase